MDHPPTPTSPAPLIVLFDGDCGLCDAWVKFVLARDPNRRFRFAPLQSPTGRNLLVQHGLDPEALDTVVLIEADRAYVRSNAVLRILVELPEPWPLAGVAVFIPQALRDTAYDFVARHRKQWFKTAEACPMPTPEQREQFLG